MRVKWAWDEYVEGTEVVEALYGTIWNVGARCGRLEGIVLGWVDWWGWWGCVALERV